MREYKICLDKEYSFDFYDDRYKVISENPTIIVYLENTEEDGVFRKSLCEFVNNPKSYLYDNPPVNEALNSNAFLLLQTEGKEIDDNLIIYYQGTVARLNEYFKHHKIKFTE